MLKDITLGQFFPGDSIIHRIDPRAKLLLTIVMIVSIFMMKSVISYAVMLGFIVWMIAVSRISPKVILRGLKPLIFIVCFTSIINIFYTSGEPIFQWYFIRITWEGLVTAFFMTVRILMLVSVTLLLTYTTSPIMLTDAIERLLSPLKKIKAPVHELAMMMTIALRFIPTLIEETDKIMSAQRARGADFESGNLWRRARALVPILVPLFIGAFRRADDLAIAMECRCYRGGQGRTKLNVAKMGVLDAAAFAVTVIFASGVATLGIYGY